MKKPPFPLNLDGMLVAYMLENYEGEIDEMTIQDIKEDGFDISMLLNWEIGCDYDPDGMMDDRTYEFTGYFISPEGYEYKIYSYHTLDDGWKLPYNDLEFE